MATDKIQAKEITVSLKINIPLRKKGSNFDRLEAGLMIREERVEGMDEDIQVRRLQRYVRDRLYEQIADLRGEGEL